MAKIVLKSLGIIQNATNSAVLVFAKMVLNSEELTVQGKVFIMSKIIIFTGFLVSFGLLGMNGSNVLYDTKVFPLVENILRVSRSV